jgi:hypothetical protein
VDVVTFASKCRWSSVNPQNCSTKERGQKEVAMKVIDKDMPVMVTGGSGYIASWIIKMLLKEGINVNATVRDPFDVQKVEHLTALAKASVGN